MDRLEGPLPLPPLGALRAFEAAARHLSFTQAAHELCVTQTAISHQVRLLEQTLGVALFVRKPQQIELTERGRAWATALRDVFARLYAANRALRAPEPPARRVVAVSVLPSFASRWLVPRMGRFLEAQPNVDLRISASRELVDLNAADFDLAIRYGAGRYASLHAEKLCNDAWVTVCSPTLKQRSKLRTVSDLAGFTLLHDDNDGWRVWLAARKARGVDATRGPLLTDSSMVVEAAVQAQGVGLVRLSLAADELAAGRLVRLFPRVAPMATGYSYYLVWSRQRPLGSEASAFREWVRKEVVALQSLGL